MGSSLNDKQEQPLGPGGDSGLQLPSTIPSRKRSFLDYGKPPYYELNIPVTRADKRPRENSYDSSSPISATTYPICTHPAGTPTSYDPSPISDYENALIASSCLHPLGQQYTDSGNKLLARKSPPQHGTPHDISPVEASLIAPPPTEISSGLGGFNGRVTVQTDSDGDVHMDNRDPEELVEICFGMIQGSVMSSRNRRVSASTALALYYHKTLMATTVHIKSRGYWGLLDSHTAAGIAGLMGLQSVRLHPFIPTQKQAGERDQGLQGSSCGTPICINIYGPETIFEDVGEVLYQKEIFLQHSLCELNVEYRNPHCLTMPKEMEPTATRTSAQMVDEVSVIFEAVEHTGFSEMDASQIVKTPLLSHQKQALSFMVEKETQQALGSRGSMAAASLGILPGAYGGILADQMGLGKSLTTLALIASTISQAEAFGRTEDETKGLLHAKTTLLIAPNSILSSWQEQIDTHMESRKLEVYRYHGSNREPDPQKLATYDIVMTTYSTIAHEFFRKRRTKAHKSPMKEIMWFRIVLDEAHIIRERSTQRSRAVYSLEAKNRWCLTGTPIQNKLDDLGSLFRFLRIRPYDNITLFNNLIVNPLKKADHQGLQRLRGLIALFSIRRTKRILDLLPRIDQTEYIQFSETEKQVYEACTRDSAALIEAALSGKTIGNSYFSILQSFLRLRLICNHGKELLPKDVSCRIEEYIKSQECPNPSNDIYTQNPVLFGDENPALCEFCSRPIKVGSRTEISTLCLHVVCSRCLLRDQAPPVQDGNEGTSQLLCPLCEETNDIQNVGEQSKPKVNWIDESSYSGPSTKVKALLGKLRACGAELSDGPIKSVVFSCWTKMLDLIALALHRERMVFRRIDGSMNLQQREDAISCFRKDPLVNILLISIGTGSVGLNITEASRVHLMEPQWNPMIEQQALDRVHRIGQTKEVITTRYIMKDSFEESVVTFQRRKLALVNLSLAQGPVTKTEALRERLEELRSLFK